MGIPGTVRGLGRPPPFGLEIMLPEIRPSSIAPRPGRGSGLAAGEPPGAHVERVRREIGQLDREHPAVPPGVQRDAIIIPDVSAFPGL
jgi:hypothetical protein